MGAKLTFCAVSDKRGLSLSPWTWSQEGAQDSILSSGYFSPSLGTHKINPDANSTLDYFARSLESLGIPGTCVSAESLAGRLVLCDEDGEGYWVRVRRCGVRLGFA